MTKKTDDGVERIGRSVPLSEDPDFQQLAELFDKLDPDRREALNEYLEERASDEQAREFSGDPVSDMDAGSDGEDRG